MSGVFVCAILLAVYSPRAINNPSFVARIKYLQCIDGFIFVAFVSLYKFRKPLWKDYTFDVYTEVKKKIRYIYIYIYIYIYRSKYYNIYSSLYFPFCLFSGTITEPERSPCICVFKN